MNKNEIYEVKIEDMTFEGFGIAKIFGMVLFVAKAVIQDEVQVRILKVKKNYAYAKIEKFIKKSPLRLNSDCEFFGKCGGCVFRNINYDDELKLKQNHVEQTIKRIACLENIKVNKIVSSDNCNFYRNKVMLPIRKIGSKIKFGFFSSNSHNFVPLNNCMLQPNVFTQILKFIINYMEKNNISQYDETTNKGIVRHVYLRKSKNEIIVCMVINDENFKFKQDFAQTLVSKFSDIVGITTNTNIKKTNVVLGEKYNLIFGRDYIYEEIAGLKFKVSVDSFFQVNTAQAKNLYAKAAQLVDIQKNEILLDLYCGTGTIGLTMANSAKEIIGIELNKDAVKDAKENAKLNNINNAKFYCTDAKNAFLKLSEIKKNPDAIIVDPPRKGMSESLIKDIINSETKRIVYISCNVATLARDLKIFNMYGYKTNHITPFDMFPRTGHVETVVLMSRKNGKL